MARTCLKPKIGMRVYQAYKPQQAGVITRVKELVSFPRPDGSTYTCDSNWYVDVLWAGTTSTPRKESQHASMHLQDFDCLIEETQRKLKTHLATKKKLDNLIETVV